MKRLAAISIFLIALAFTSDLVTRAKENYEWQKAVPPGRGCFQPDCREGQFPMAILPLVAFENKLWSIGDSRVWTSADGVAWQSQPKTDWGERYGMRFVFFKDRLWMMGGMKTWDDFLSDVWTSSDGKEWRQVVSKAAWSPRRGHGAVVFKDKLWILGGALSSGRANELPTRFLNDVWSSPDGVNWTLATANAPWSARDSHTTLVFNNQIWVIGGGVRGKSCDVWSSADGVNWTLVTANAPWGERHGNGGLVFDGKIWIFGGIEKNDVWHSSDGKRWQREFEHAPWSTRSAMYSVAFNNKLWIFSGKTGRSDTQSGDIWTMGKRIT